MKSVFKILSLEIDNLKIEFKAETNKLKSSIEALERNKLSVELIKSISKSMMPSGPAQHATSLPTPSATIVYAAARAASA